MLIPHGLIWSSPCISSGGWSLAPSSSMWTRSPPVVGNWSVISWRLPLSSMVAFRSITSGTVNRRIQMSLALQSL